MGEIFLFTVWIQNIHNVSKVLKQVRSKFYTQEGAANRGGRLQKDTNHTIWYVMGRYTDWNNRQKPFIRKPFCDKPQPVVNFLLKSPTEVCNPLLVYTTHF
jgi:hypothetical protein